MSKSLGAQITELQATVESLTAQIEKGGADCNALGEASLKAQSEHNAALAEKHAELEAAQASEAAALKGADAAAEATAEAITSLQAERDEAQEALAAVVAEHAAAVEGKDAEIKTLNAKMGNPAFKDAQAEGEAAAASASPDVGEVSDIREEYAALKGDPQARSKFWKANKAELLEAQKQAHAEAAQTS